MKLSCFHKKSRHINHFQRHDFPRHPVFGPKTAVPRSGNGCLRGFRPALDAPRPRPYRGRDFWITVRHEHTASQIEIGLDRFLQDLRPLCASSELLESLFAGFVGLYLPVYLVFGRELKL